MDWDSVSPFWLMIIGAAVSAVIGGIIGGVITWGFARRGTTVLRTELGAATRELRAETTKLQDQGAQLRGLTHLVINILEFGGLIETVRRNDRGEPEPAQTHVITATAQAGLDSSARLTHLPKANRGAQDGIESEEG